MIQLTNEIFYGAEEKPSYIDLEIPEKWNERIVLFIHGYKGFKDWGCWPLVQRYFVEQGFGFCKYNITHNGVALGEPTTFNDLEGFRYNSYSKEMEDQSKAMKWVNERTNQTNRFCVIGHSRGGGIALLNHDLCGVEQIATWAAISDISSRFPEELALEKWRVEGVQFVKNGRTNQNMPHDYSQYTDFLENEDQLNIEKAARNILVPVKLLHGEDDTSVRLSEGEQLAKWTSTKLEIIKNAQHTFNSSHPWSDNQMPAELMKVCKLTLDFFTHKATT